MGTLVRTLDLDSIGGERELFERMDRISKCFAIRDILYRVSSGGNGYHVRLECFIPNREKADDCDCCRIAFDSDFRFMLDTCFRMKHQRNVLWRRKVYQKGDNRMLGEAGAWMRYKSDETPKMCLPYKMPIASVDGDSISTAFPPDTQITGTAPA